MISIYISVGLAVLAAGTFVGWAVKRSKKQPEPKAPQLVNRLEGKLEKTKNILGQKLAGGVSSWDSIEEALLEADIGVSTTQLLVEQAKKTNGAEDNTAKTRLTHEMVQLLNVPRPSLSELLEKNHPLVISVVGINGAGKTTTIGKLAHYFKSSGKKVLLGAGDTFRAGAIAQLKTWADRVGADFVTGREGADPGAVAFDSVTAGKAREMDVVLLDTAGRLHTKSNLMEELKKIHKVIKKVIPEAPHETWLVLDGTLGQNSLNQAKEFKQALGVTGLIVTKLDGTSKGGAVFPISKELSLPVHFVGVGESLDDLVPFEAEKFVQAILG